MKKKIVSCMAVIIIINIFFYLEACNSKNINQDMPYEYMDKIFNNEKVININIDISDKDWEEIKNNSLESKYYSADMTINDSKYKNVGIKLMKNNSFRMLSSDKYKFEIKSNEYVDNQTIYGLSKLILDNNIDDITSMKEYIAYDMLNMLNASARGFSYANVKINGEMWGIYLALEGIENEFIQRNFSNDSGNLYDVEDEFNRGYISNREFPEPPLEINKSLMRMEDEFELDNFQTPPPDKMGRPEDNFAYPPLEGMEKPREDFKGDPPYGMNNNKIDMKNKPSDITDNERKKADFQNKPYNEGRRPEFNLNGAALLYKDDNIESYSEIFNGSIFDRTSDEEKQNLINIIKNLNSSTDLEKYIDIDEVLKYFAVNAVIVNLDGYSGLIKHNYYIYEENSMIKIIANNYNLAFAGDNIDDSKKAVNFPIDKPVIDKLENSPLLYKLLQVNEYKEKYHSYIEELLNNYLSDEVFEKKVDKLNNLIGQYKKEDNKDLYTYDEYIESLSNLKLFAHDRSQSIKAQLEGKQPSDSYGNIETNVNITFIGRIGEEFMPKNKNVDMNQVMRIVFKENENNCLTDNGIEQLKEIGLNEDEINQIQVKMKELKNRFNSNQDFNESITEKINKILIGVLCFFVLISVCVIVLRKKILLKK